jgi:hypothetical protein
VGSGGTGIVEVGDGVAELDGEPLVGTESEGDGFGEVPVGGLEVELGDPDPLGAPGVGLMSARAGRASARQIAAVNTATAPRRTTGKDTPQFLPIKTSPGRTAG